MILQTITDLRATAGSPSPSDNHAKVIGYNTPGDGGGGDFYWEVITTASTDDNDGTIFVVSGVTTGRWRRYYSESINVKWFGATGDGTTNDSPAFQKMIDWCEPMGIKDVVIPFGKFYLEESVYVRIGGIKFIGQGCLLKEDSWYSGGSSLSFQPYDTYFYNGSILIIKKNISGIVYDTAVSDSVYWRGVGFIAEEGRTIGNTYAIDFRSTFIGPTWPFNVHECYFACFNRVFNFDGDDTLQNIGSINITYCAFSSNDEVIYQGFKAGTNNRYTCWGLNFQNNKAHWNSRVIYGCFGKDLVTISDNNLEGNQNYIDDTTPPYIVDIETYSCAVIFHGNHFEGVISDCVSISSLAKNADGSYKTTVVDTAPYVDIYGNNCDGISSDFKSYTLAGCIVRMNEGREGGPSAIYVHQCEILENSRASIYLTDYAKEHGTMIKFTNPESLSSGFIHSVNSYGTGLDNNTKGFLIDGEQWVRTSRSGFGLGSGHAFKGDVKYCIATFKMRNDSAYSPASSAYCKFTKDGTANPDYYVYGSLFPPVGESIAVCIFPAEGVFTSTSNNVFSVGMGSGSNNSTGDTTEIEYCSSVFMYTTMESNPQIIPVFEPTNVVDETNGTFIEGQTFFNGTDLKMVTESGTMVTNFYWSPTAYFVTSISGNKIELNGTYEYFTQGQYIDISGATYRIIELRGLEATLDKAPAFTTGATIGFHAPTFSTLIDDDNIGDYAILNQNASAQTANAWISGDFKAESSITVSDNSMDIAPTNGIFSKGSIIIKSGGLGFKRDLTDQSGRRNWSMSTENNVVGDWTLSVSTTNTGDTTNTVMSALGNGKIGIGVSSPAQKLDVDGTIRQSAVTSSMLKANSSGDIVAATAGTDYVAPGTLDFGTYTPTVTAISGITDIYIVETFTYTRVGTIVHVAGTIKVSPASYVNPLRTMNVSLPIASDITVEYGIAGVGNGRNDNGQIIEGATVCGDPINNNAQVVYEASDELKLYLQFDYIVQ